MTRKAPDDPKLIEAEANIAAYIERVLAAAPPLSTEQRVNLAELLKPVRLSAFELGT